MLDRLSGWLIGRSGSSPRPAEEAGAAGADAPTLDVRPTDRDRVCT
jgi:hypothetical protein